MPDITYSLGGTAFNAVPQIMEDSADLPVRTESTLARGLIHAIGVGRNTIVLKGQYMTPGVKTAIESVYDACASTGATAVFNDGYQDRNVLVRKFATVPIVGKTEGYSFVLELITV